MCGIVALLKKMKLFLAHNRNGSGRYARKRLEVIILCDRLYMNHTTMEKLKRELAGIVTKYVEIDKEAARLEVARDGNSVRLVAIFPVRVNSRALDV